MKNEYGELESLLARYRPSGPPPALRSRVLALLDARCERRRSRRRSLWFDLAAALVLVSCVLNLATETIYRENARLLKVGEYEWTKEMEDVASLLDGDGWGRRYLALQLSAGILVDPSSIVSYEDLWRKKPHD